MLALIAACAVLWLQRGEGGGGMTTADLQALLRDPAVARDLAAAETDDGS